MKAIGYGRRRTATAPWRPPATIRRIWSSSTSCSPTSTGSRCCAACVPALLRRREPDTGRHLRFADLTVDAASREVRRAERDILLTPREYELLMCLLRNARVVLTREQLLERVWGIDFAADTHVLEV